MTGTSRLRVWLAGLLLGAVCAAGMAPARAQVVVTRQLTPGGVAYTHAAMPQARIQTMALGWAEAARAATAAEAALLLLLPDALAEGPAGVGAAAFNEQLEDRRAGFSVTAQDDAMRLSFHGPAGDFPAVAADIAALLAHPALTATRFERLRKDARLAARHQSQSAEHGAYSLTLRHLLPPGGRIAGLVRDPAAFEDARHEALVAWFSSRFARSNLKVAVAGPLTPAEIGPRIDAIAAALPAAATLAPRPFPPSDPDSAALTLIQPVTQAQIFAGGLARDIATADRTLAEVATQVLWSGFASRLFHRLRERLGAAYSASGQLIWLEEGAAAFVIRTAVDPMMAADAQDALIEEYRRWQAEGISQEELDGARGRLMMWRREGRRAPGNLAAALLTADLTGAGNPADAEARLAAMPLAEVNAFIRSRFPADVPVTVRVVPEVAMTDAACPLHTPDGVPQCD